MGRTPASLAWSALATGASPGLRVLLEQRRRAGKEIAGRLGERRGFGHEPPPDRPLLWLHAASVGETNAVLPVLRALGDRTMAGAPRSILLTTATASSSRLLAPLLPELGLAWVRHRMVPLDVPRWVGRFLDAWRPDAAAFVESELWPNMLAGLRARSIPAALLNGRISARSARRWSWLPGLSAELLGGFGTVWARSEEDARRLSALGARVERVADLKQAAEPPGCDPGELARIRQAIGRRPLWLAASTHQGEEEIVAAADRLLRARYPDLLTIIAPRHPPRGAAIARTLGGAPRRSAGEPPGGAFWVFDTLGELGLAYRLAPLVLVGRSLPPASGGQNPLEPARLGCCLATGPQTANFSEARALLERADALTVVDDATALADWLARGLADPRAAVAAGERARLAASAPSDLVEETAAMLRRLLAS
jgi:3-deoxy-D-manno-octulosonic-acid transferase